MAADEAEPYDLISAVLYDSADILKKVPAEFLMFVLEFEYTFATLALTPSQQKLRRHGISN